MKYEFIVLKPEDDFIFVDCPQMLVAGHQLGELHVIIYFMANDALEITGGIASTTMGKVILQYTAISPSGAYAASQSLHKIAFRFASPKGMPNKFEFKGQKV